MESKQAKNPNCEDKRKREVFFFLRELEEWSKMTSPVWLVKVRVHYFIWLANMKVLFQDHNCRMITVGIHVLKHGGCRGCGGLGAALGVSRRR